MLTYTGCNVLCCRVFKRRVKYARSLLRTQLCRWSWWTHLSLKIPMLSYLDGLKPYYCNKFSLETFDVISVWLNSVINPKVLCVSALPIQGWHWSTETWPSEVGLLHVCKNGNLILVSWYPIIIHSCHYIDNHHSPIFHIFPIETSLWVLPATSLVHISGHTSHIILVHI